jgi:hypothetical protein
MPPEKISGMKKATTTQTLWKCRDRGNRGKPDSGFPPFPPPLGNRPWGDFHIPTATTTVSSFPESKPTAHALRGVHDRKKRPKKGEIRSQPKGPTMVLVSGSPRIGISSSFQAHFWIGKCCS